MTDQKIILKPPSDYTLPLPEKILFISPNSFSTDQLIKSMEKIAGNSIKMLRIGHSLSNQELNKKYSIEILSGASKGDKIDRSE